MGDCKCLKDSNDHIEDLTPSVRKDPTRRKGEVNGKSEAQVVIEMDHFMGLNVIAILLILCL